MENLPYGVELMRRIDNGELKKAPLAYIEKVKQEIIENCEELIEVGARIRPLLVDGTQMGWVRAVHDQERQRLKRWVKNPNDFILHTILLATSLTKEEIEDMSSFEVRGIAEVVKQMGECDASLFPFLSAYVTTQSSENLWFGKGEKLTSFENRVITLPDNKQIKILVPPDHSKMWASLCTYREQAKKRLEDNFNSLFIVRPWAGKSADPIANELKGVAKSLETNSNEPWERIISTPPAINVQDGWAHAGDSVEDLQRELKGMLDGDKHEKVMEAWAKQMEDEAIAQKKKLDALRERKGTKVPGIVSERMMVFTDAQIRQRQLAAKQGQPPVVESRDKYEYNHQDRRMEKIIKYR